MRIRIEKEIRVDLNKEEVEKILGQAVLNDLVSRGHIKTTKNMKPSFMYMLYPDGNGIAGELILKLTEAVS
jgi:hypothetical protein